jgi:hypothetical protein
MLQTEVMQQQHFERGLREVFEAGDGVLTLTVIGPASAASLIAAVVAGDVATKVVLNAADQLLRRMLSGQVEGVGASCEAGRPSWSIAVGKGGLADAVACAAAGLPVRTLKIAECGLTDLVRRA